MSDLRSGSLLTSMLLHTKSLIHLLGCRKHFNLAGHCLLYSPRLFPGPHRCLPPLSQPVIPYHPQPLHSAVLDSVPPHSINNLEQSPGFTRRPWLPLLYHWPIILTQISNSQIQLFAEDGMSMRTWEREKKHGDLFPQISMGRPELLIFHLYLSLYWFKGRKPASGEQVMGPGIKPETHIVKRREPIPTSCPLTSMGAIALYP